MLWIIAVVCIFLKTTASQNITYQEGAAGSKVTLLSIVSIHQSGVFGDDNELLRRIAYTETRDGTLSSTYRSGYHGGIWAVDENQFLRTKNTTQYARLPEKFQQIQLYFEIDWSSVQWRELRKPLYSALAARLVIYIAPVSIPSADDLPAQAQFWVSHYNNDGDASAFVTASSGLQGTVSESSANEFFLGFTVNYQPNVVESLQFFVSTPESSPVSFSVSASGFNYTGTATNHSTTVVTLPTSLEVINAFQRNKGIHVKAEGERKIVVYGISYEQYSTDAFLALPCSNLAVDSYEYYGATYPIPNRTSTTGNILLVGCEDQTRVTTSTTTFTLNRLETYLIESFDTSGLRVTSTKPISFFSNNECTSIPDTAGYCDHLTEQIPPTLTWGHTFLASSLEGRTSGEIFRVIAAQSSTVVMVRCTSLSQDYNLLYTGNWAEFWIDSNSFCFIESSAPILLVQFALGSSLDSVGDPFMMMIPPVEQYNNNYLLNVFSAFSTNYITIYVAPRYYQPDWIFVDENSQRNTTWSAVRCVNISICGYITRLSLTAGEHRVYHQDPEARVGVSVYGFNSSNSYGYPGGLKLTPIQLAIVSFQVASYRISERQESLRVNITRSGNLQNASVVLVASDNFQGTASARDHYSSFSEIVEFMPGQTERHIFVQINNDMRIEDNETFELYLIAGAGVNLTPIPRTEITIENDDDTPTNFMPTPNNSVRNTDATPNTFTSVDPTRASLGTITVTVIVGVVVAILISAISLFVVIWIVRRKKKVSESSIGLSKLHDTELKEEKDLQFKVQSSFIKENKLKIPIISSCNLELGKTVGQGEFGIVYRGHLKRYRGDKMSNLVAIKTIKGFVCKELADDLLKECSKMSTIILLGFVRKELADDLLKECSKMCEFDHPNVLKVIGVCVDGGPAPYIIMPFMANGSLLAYLRKERENIVLVADSSSEDINTSLMVLLDMCLQVAKGMEYLASKRVIHRDLAARNCMIDINNVIKVADFGLSECLDITKEYFRLAQDDVIRLPVKWLAPESISDGVFSEKSDIWSYGVTCWEIFSGGKIPYPGIPPADLPLKLETGYRAEKPLNAACTDETYQLMNDCWAQKPEGRPSFSQIVSHLSELLQNMAGYLDLAAGTVDNKEDIGGNRL